MKRITVLSIITLHRQAFILTENVVTSKGVIIATYKRGEKVKMGIIGG